MTDTSANLSPEALSALVKEEARKLGIAHCAITDTNLGEHETNLLNWLDAGFHGSMDYMQRHGVKRSRPAELVPGTMRIVSVRMDYFPPDSADAWSILNDPYKAYV